MYQKCLRRGDLRPRQLSVLLADRGYRYEGYLNERVVALPELLHDAGYLTLLAGTCAVRRWEGLETNMLQENGISGSHQSTVRMLAASNVRSRIFLHARTTTHTNLSSSLQTRYLTS